VMDLVPLLVKVKMDRAVWYGFELASELSVREITILRNKEFIQYSVNNYD
jgi:hypothetical protein